MINTLIRAGYGAIAGLLGLTLAVGATSVMAQSVEPDPPQPLRPSATCPDDIEALAAGLLRDLPGYANRVAARSLSTATEPIGFATVILAGRAEFEPLDISPLTFSDRSDPAADVQQIFFTTLEREYTSDSFFHLEHYHWLFLAPDQDGWRLALMFSRLAPDENETRPPTPPRESSKGILGQAVQLWLRDCRAGAIYPVEGELDESGEPDESDAFGEETE